MALPDIPALARGLNEPGAVLRRGRGVRLGVVAALAATLPAIEARAGAWPMPKGEGQVIFRYERQTAEQAFDARGATAPIEPRWDESATAFVEYGITDRLTLQGKAGVARGADAFAGYEGAAPAELGLRWTARRTSRGVASLYLGAITPGEGENAIYVSRVRSHGDLEARVLLGRSGRARGRPVFGEVQAARLWRIDASDETRLDVTVGVEATPAWLALAQAYSGVTDDAGGPLRPGWANGELSLVRRLEGWRLQAGYRVAGYGRDTTRGSGPVLGVWRSF